MKWVQVGGPAMGPVVGLTMGPALPIPTTVQSPGKCVIRSLMDSSKVSWSSKATPWVGKKLLLLLASVFCVVLVTCAQGEERGGKFCCFVHGDFTLSRLHVLGFGKKIWYN